MIQANSLSPKFNTPTSQVFEYTPLLCEETFEPNPKRHLTFDDPHPVLENFSREEVSNFVDLFMEELSASTVSADTVRRQICEAPLAFITSTVIKMIPFESGMLLILPNVNVTLLELIHLAVECLCHKVHSVVRSDYFCTIYTTLREFELDLISIDANCYQCRSIYAELFDCVKCNRKATKKRIMNP